MTSIDGNHKPTNLPLSASQTLTEGLIFKKDSGNTLTVYTTQADKPLGIVDQPKVDSEQTAITDNAAGDEWGFFIIGSGAIVNVASVSGDTYTLGDAVYGGQSADTDGHCSNDTSNSVVRVGHCVKAVTTTSAGELIQVILDVAQTE